VFHHYRRLIELRHTEPAVVHGDFTMLLADDPHVFAYVRRWSGTELLVLANFAAEPHAAALDDLGWWTAELVLGNWPEPAAGSEAVLRAWESRVYRRSRTVGSGS
jgi:oligo-1,6-glucosidase